MEARRWPTIENLILIVDDELDNVKLLEKRLQADGYQTLLAYNGEEALRLARAELPDLILLDLMMPDLSGYDVAQTLKSEPHTAAIPYIFISAKSAVDSRVCGLEMGASDYIIKPFHYKELLARIKNTLQNYNQLSRLKNENSKLHQLSIVDDLTGLYNRRYFAERLEEEISRADRYNYKLACLMIDIDYFKNINDQYGHLIGDIILKDLAEVIRSSIRVVDVAARFGGEEFVVLLPQTDLQGGLFTAEKIRSKTESHPFRSARDISLTVSAGISCYEQNHPGALSLLDQADQALYEAKEMGRNTSQIYTGTNTQPL